MTDELKAFDRFGNLAIDDSACQQWQIGRRPNGNVTPDDFTWAEVEIPEPGEGEVLLKTLYLGLAPVMRMYMAGTDSTGARKLDIGDVIHGRGVAQVVKSRHPDYREGEIVQGQLGWQTYKVSAMTPQERFFKMPHKHLPASHGTSALGMTGLSAHAGFWAAGDPREGDLTVVSGAAGGVGSMVVQMAANVLGNDVVGIAGGTEKCNFIKELGCASAIDYKAENIPERLDALRPDGIDYYFDNVGGETLTAVLERLRMHSRIVLCGSISEYILPEKFGLKNYTRLRATDSRMQGFFVYNHTDRWDAVMDEMAGWIADGKLKPVEYTTHGFQNMPRGLASLYTGANVGSSCCSVRGEPEEWV